MQVEGLRLVRPREAQKRLGVGHTFFWEELVNRGRIRLVKLGKRAKAVPEHELNALIGELITERDRVPEPEHARPGDKKMRSKARL